MDAGIAPKKSVRERRVNSKQCIDEVGDEEKVRIFGIICFKIILYAQKP
jgi:hypothetical protein